jgi:hypothetical protein
MKPEVLPIESALEDPRVRETFQDADVILGIDRGRAGREVVMSGRTQIERVAKLGRSEPLRVLRLSFDSRTRSLELFVAACSVLRGRCDYKSSKDLAEEERHFRDSWGASPPKNPDR